MKVYIFQLSKKMRVERFASTVLAMHLLVIVFKKTATGSLALYPGIWSSQNAGALLCFKV